tara:strand:- start:919 stop:1431 length:513 start_codon:yes stop_codon:yes gene_type:complete
MKKILLAITTLLAFSCTQKTPEAETEQTDKVNVTETPVTAHKSTPDFDWLVGKWKRLNEEEGKETFENWEKVSATEYTGLGYTLQNGDTISQEQMMLVKHKNEWDIMVKTPEEKEAVIFPVSAFNEGTFTCNNDSIDFPNTIKYWKEGEHIFATIANEEMRIQFEFERLQ